MIVALVLAALAIGTLLFHLFSPWWWTPIASNWGAIDTTINIMFLITGVVCVAIILFMAYCVYRFRHRGATRQPGQPLHSRLEFGLTAATTIGVAAMLIPGLMIWKEYVQAPEDALTVEVMGQQWQWSYRLPGKDGRLGASDVRFVSADNPLGVNPKDPYSADDIVVTGDDLHLPIGRPVKVLLRSLDVIHDFYVPEFRAKMDLMPGMETYFWLTPERKGNFEILCAAYCGVGHPQMRGSVVIDSSTDFDAWSGKQKTFIDRQRSASAEAVSPRH